VDTQSAVPHPQSPIHTNLLFPSLLSSFFHTWTHARTHTHTHTTINEPGWHGCCCYCWCFESLRMQLQNYNTHTLSPSVSPPLSCESEQIMEKGKENMLSCPNQIQVKCIIIAWTMGAQHHKTTNNVRVCGHIFFIIIKLHPKLALAHLSSSTYIRATVHQPWYHPSLSTAIWYRLNLVLVS